MAEKFHLTRRRCPGLPRVHALVNMYPQDSRITKHQRRKNRKGQDKCQKELARRKTPKYPHQQNHGSPYGQAHTVADIHRSKEITLLSLVFQLARRTGSTHLPQALKYLTAQTTRAPEPPNGFESTDLLLQTTKVPSTGLNHAVLRYSISVHYARKVDRRGDPGGQAGESSIDFSASTPQTSGVPAPP